MCENYRELYSCENYTELNMCENYTELYMCKNYTELCENTQSRMCESCLSVFFGMICDLQVVSICIDIHNNRRK